MGWNALEVPWRVCFEMSWQSFKNGSIPIGAVIVNQKGEIVARGRSLQYEDEGEEGEIKHHKLSHAELNALLKVSEFDHPRIREYTIYTTTEPCPLCFGAIVMSNVRNVRYAARDRFAGGSGINQSIPYIMNKKITINGPVPELEKIQIALHTAYELKRGYKTERLLDAWCMDAPESVMFGRKIFKDNVLERLIRKDASAADVFDWVSNTLN